MHIINALRSRFVCTLHLCVLTLSLAFGQTEHFIEIPFPADFYNQFTQNGAQVNTFYARFTQVKYISYLDASVESMGVLYFKKPGLIRWQYEEPYKFSVIVKKGDFLLSDSEGKLSFKERDNNFFNQIGVIIEESLNGMLLEHPGYSVTLYVNSSLYKLKVIPSDSAIQDIIPEIDILFKKDDFELFSFLFMESSGDITTINFSQTDTNLSIPDSRFQP